MALVAARRSGKRVVQSLELCGEFRGLVYVLARQVKCRWIGVRHTLRGGAHGGLRGTVRKAARVRVGYHGPPLTNKSVNTE
jgi:hypothetical protein